MYLKNNACIKDIKTVHFTLSTFAHIFKINTIAHILLLAKLLINAVTILGNNRKPNAQNFRWKINGFHSQKLCFKNENNSIGIEIPRIS